jgi:amino acid transporter
VRLGTFFGVFLPCLLTILGVILFLRLGWVAGNLGLLQTWLLITLATAITLVTALSVAAIATNMKVGGGGSYYMISRSLGLEIGGAIGLPLYLGKTLGVAFYLLGFAESLRGLLPQYSLAQLASASLALLAVLTLISTQLAARSQLPVFLMLFVSLAGLAVGAPPEGGFAAVDTAPEPVGFWIAFAVFFPAVTGIEAGIGLSGNLRRPERAIPIGSLAAVGVSYLIYMLVPLLLLTWVPPSLLRSDDLIMLQLMPHESLFYAGIWGAALSSALVNLLAAPHMLQQLARDRLLPAALGRGSGGDDTPRAATLLTLAIVLAALWSGGLNSIAKALSMFFLTTYGMLNLAAAIESFLDNPSWRPAFRVPWWISFLGAVASFAVMFFLNALASVFALAVCLLIYLWLQQRHLGRRWSDIRTGAWMFLTRALLYRLRDYEPDVRNWRPNLLVFTGAPTRHWYLVELANALSQNRGLLTLATLLRRDRRENALLEGGLAQLYRGRRVAALSRVYRIDDLREGMRQMMRFYGYGPLRPNTIMLSPHYDFQGENDLVDVIRESYDDGFNVIVAREAHSVGGRNGDGSRSVDGAWRPGQRPSRDSGETNRRPELHLWWSGHHVNLGFMLAIAYLVRHSHYWGGLSIEIQCTEPDHDRHSAMLENLSEILAHARLSARTHNVAIGDGERLGDAMARVSSNAEIVLLGMRPPAEDESAEDYAAYFRDLESQLPELPLLIQALAAEDLPFIELFR